MTTVGTGNSDGNGDDVLSQAGRAVWRFVLLIASVIVGAATIIAADHLLASKAAAEVIAPTAAKLDMHLAASAEAREHMVSFVAEDRAARKAMMKKLDALCRANPKAECPLGLD